MVDAREKSLIKWAVIRIVLGWLQMAGAAATLVLLVVTGVSPATLGTATAAVVCSATSIVLFRILKVQNGGSSLGD